MYWIESVKRAPYGSYLLGTRDLDGRLTNFKPSDFPNIGGVATKVRATVTSSQHTVTPVDDYLRHMGWQRFFGGGQQLHRFRTESLEIWVPSQAMFKMLFSTFSALYDAAFCGRSLREIVAPSCTESPMDLMPGWRRRCVSSLYERTVTGEPNTLMRRLFWLLHSESAGRSFRYVFRNASMGILDIPLPQGTFEVHVAGKRIGDLMLATRVRMASVFSDDLLRFDGVPLSPMRIDFTGRDQSVFREHSTGSNRVAEIQRWELDDRRFHDLLESMFRDGMLGRRERYTVAHERVLKRHLELLRARFLGNHEWKSLPCSRQELACVQVRLYKLRKAKHWEKLSEMLLKQ
jgi:hypothetical protein